MTESDTSSDATTDDEPSADEQFGAFTTDDGDTIVYDRTNSAAWIQSDYAVEVGGDSSSA
ncbi:MULTISPECIES: DUF7331 family protein [Halomicrobium]|uniref:Uncharacterized protein n=2 Tax=Halomicrobium mukohataei TaxID=57705 RepID=C7NXR1_HALMD|nr:MULTISPECIES: hypothetical protein [Halomicrobium]ACV46499.1 conserved hypothetical protein [Halomicrobium mukohataei DSM 12286]QCD65046.1 hypothetical protein E5139_05100 [Halomicrobium mukohataei]QFR19852.1 hypothetical protein GBQ70_05095 [Halomicrobium sp. ZPS1]